MTKGIYSGHIVREYLNGEDFICMYDSDKKIFVKAWDKISADLLIHEVYGRNQEKWTPNRTSDKFPGDKIYIKDLKLEEDGNKYSHNLEKLVEDSMFFS